MDSTEQIKQFQEFIETDDELLYKAKNCEKHLRVDILNLLKFSPDLVTEFIQSPEETLKAFEVSIREMRKDPEVPDKDIQVRFYNTEKIQTNNIRIRDIRVTHYGKLKCITGIIRHISSIEGEIISIKYECLSCGNVLNVLQQRFFDKKEPSKCSCGRKGKFLKLSEEVIDTQRIVIEEELDTIEGTQQPNRIMAILQKGLCSKEIEKFQFLGSRVVVSGIILPKPKINRGIVTNMLEKYIEANYITLLNERFKDILITEKDREEIKKLSKRKDILDVLGKSVATHIYGYDEIKKALVLQVFGGVTRFNQKTKRKERGNFHILLIGDPSTSKTQLAKSIEPIALKYFYANGIRSSKTGLTAMLVKDETSNLFGLEAGALILANNGICILDEFDKMTDDDKVALHEAMEEQCITINKANIHTQLESKTSILCCANFKDNRFNPYEEIYTQINLPPSLISRFDLCYPFIDKPDKDKDKHIMDSMLGVGGETQPIVDMELFYKYVIVAKEFTPEMTDSVKKIISSFYVNTREKSYSNNKFILQITARQGDAIRRLSEASARIHLRNVTEEDVKTATDIFMHSLKLIAGDSAGIIDIDKVETGVSFSQRDFLHAVRKAIDTLTPKFNKLIPIDEIIKDFEGKERMVEDTLEIMKKSGDIFEPRRGYISKI